MQATVTPFTHACLRRLPHRSQRGISLIEILVVLAIIALLSTGVAIFAINAWVKAQNEVAAKEIGVLSQAVETYQLERGRCPKDTQELLSAGMIKQLEADPWGTPYAFTCPGEHAEFDIASAGKDQEFGTDDDVTSWDRDPERRASAE